MKRSKTNKYKRRSNKRPGHSKNIASDWAFNFIPYEQRLNELVIGQHDAVERVSSILACHVNRERMNTDSPTSRVLIVGGPSVGKTYLVDKAADILQLPKTYANCSMISPPGYRGYDTSSMLKNLVTSAGSIQRAERSSVLILDEIDKLQRRGRDSFLKQIEFSMLPILNGEPVLIDNEESESPQLISTKNTLVFTMGVFPELPPSSWKSADSSQKALIKYGFSEEFVSRFSHFIYMPPISNTDFKELVFREVESISKLYKTKNDAPHLSPSDMKQILKFSDKSKFGLRGLRTNIHEVLFAKAKANSIDAYF